VLRHLGLALPGVVASMALPAAVVAVTVLVFTTVTLVTRRAAYRHRLGTVCAVSEIDSAGAAVFAQMGCQPPRRWSPPTVATLAPLAVPRRPSASMR
jgi:hypothetical protein